MEKECKIHGITSHARYAKRWRCKKCNVIAVTKRRKKIKTLALGYLGNKCQKCGYDKCANSLDFHHIEPEHKDFGISEKGYTRSWEEVKGELDKCMLVCKNCHGEIHEELSKGLTCHIETQ